MALNYLGFEVEIGAKDDDGSPLAVLHSPAGNARGRQCARPVAPDAERK